MYFGGWRDLTLLLSKVMLCSCDPVITTVSPLRLAILDASPTKTAFEYSDLCMYLCLSVQAINVPIGKIKLICPWPTISKGCEQQ